jgi:hypothetical protein
MWSVLSRFRLASHARRMFSADSFDVLGQSPMLPYLLVAAHEQHAQQIVVEVSCEAGLRRVAEGRFGASHVLLEQSTASGASPQLCQQRIVCHAIQPRRRVVGLARAWPGLERRHHRGLHGILHGLDVSGSHAARQRRYEPAVLVAKEGRYQLW